MPSGSCARIEPKAMSPLFRRRSTWEASAAGASWAGKSGERNASNSSVSSIGLLLRSLALDHARTQALAEGHLAQEQGGEGLGTRRSPDGPRDLDVHAVLDGVLRIGD